MGCRKTKRPPTNQTRHTHQPPLSHLHPHALPVDEAARLKVQVPPVPPPAALARQVGAFGGDGVRELCCWVGGLGWCVWCVCVCVLLVCVWGEGGVIPTFS
jgi:hypothetical protein